MRDIFILGGLGFLGDDTIISEDYQRGPKSCKEARSLPKTSEVPVPVLQPVLFTSKIRDRTEGIVI